MVYLRVEHTEDNDEDLYRFQTLNECIDFIRKEFIEHYVISDIDLNGYEPEDYTLIEKDSKD